MFLSFKKKLFFSSSKRLCIKFSHFFHCPLSSPLPLLLKWSFFPRSPPPAFTSLLYVTHYVWSGLLTWAWVGGWLLDHGHSSVSSLLKKMTLLCGTWLLTSPSLVSDLVLVGQILYRLGAGHHPCCRFTNAVALSCLDVLLCVWHVLILHLLRPSTPSSMVLAEPWRGDGDV